ncbi:Spherulation-specific family 4 [Hyaloscypha variabilis]
MNGIFFDEGCNDCGPDNVSSKLYQTITQNTKDLYPGAITVLNSGVTMPQCFEQSADTLVTFEGSYETYTTAYVPKNWNPTDTRKLWHIIYNVPHSQGAAVVTLALQRGAALVEITNGVTHNPYYTLADDAHMQQVRS